jgi:SAM-dependent methyltransferase
MLYASTDRAWERFGKADPYFGVLVEPKYKASALTNEARDDFFRSGDEYVERMMKRIDRLFGHECAFNRALDFGCGVGRLILPLARHAKEVIGVDISDSMLEEARRNCQRHNRTNISLVKSDNHLSLLSGRFDLIHSYIVLQHIPVRRGYRLIENLLARLEEGGIGVLHVTYAKAGFMRKWVSRIKKHVPLANNIVNLMRGRRFFAPQMQMNNYDLNRLCWLMQTDNFGEFYAEYTDHGGNWGVILYFQRRGNF